MNSEITIINRKGEREHLNLQRIEARLDEAIGEVTKRHSQEFITFNHQFDKSLLLLKVYQSLDKFTTTSQLDECIARVCMNLALNQYEYGYLASHMTLSNLHRNMTFSFREFVFEYMPWVYLTYIANNRENEIRKRWENLLCDLEKHLEKTKERDFQLDYFGLKTLERSYLCKSKTNPSIIVESPQYLFMRVAITIHCYDLMYYTRPQSQYQFNVLKDLILNTYDLLSERCCVHATPTLFNAGLDSKHMNLSSCYLLGTEDSVDGIFKTISDCAKISKNAGGIGIHISNIRGRGAKIYNGGTAEGILKMMKVYNDTARYINQGSKRKGSIAMYLEPWHVDVFEFLDAMRKNGDEETICRDLFYGLWIPNLFMQYVEENKEWYLMSPDECPGLTDCYGKEFDQLYLQYVKEKRYRRQVMAQDIWKIICRCQIESGMPYMLYKDHVNIKNNQKNGGTIKSSNLCTEIVQLSDNTEYGVCNLASICLPRMLSYPPILLNDTNEVLQIFYINNCSSCKLLNVFLYQCNRYYELNNLPLLRIENINCDENPTYRKLFTVFPHIRRFNHKTKEILEQYVGFRDFLKTYRPFWNATKLRRVVHTLVDNLNKIIDINTYPVIEAKNSNLYWRPIGIGVQGLADVFIECWLSYTSPEAKEMNRQLFEMIYYYALEKSNELATKRNSYMGFKDSPLSKGIFQFDLWTKDSSHKRHQTESVYELKNSSPIVLNWQKLREEIQENGVRNSLLIALMPTASTSQIMGCSECFEPLTTNIYTRHTLSGQFVVINSQLIRILKAIGQWNEEIKSRIMYHRGSVKELNCLPEYIKLIFATAWEIGKRDLIDMAADRGAYIDQSQSMNFFVADCDVFKLTKIHFYGWRKGLKTGSYYIRSRPSTNPQLFTIDPLLEKKLRDEDKDKDKDKNQTQEDISNDCLSCSS